MRKLIAVTVALLALFATACATQYAPADESWTSGGFTELRLAPNKWHVIIEANDMTTRKEVNQFLLRRAAELTLEQGKRYFTLEEQDARVKRRVSYSGNMITTLRNQGVVTAHATQEKDAFDAIQIIKETDEAAEGKLSARAREAMQTMSGV